MTWRSISICISVLPALCGAGRTSSIYGQRPGQLGVAPTRVVLEGKDRSAELVLVNLGDSEATYRVSLVDMRMTEDGHLERVQTDEQPDFSAKSMLRYSPRQITLGPGATQRVRIAVMRVPNLPDGEYRSHILFEALPKPMAPGVSADPSMLSIRFNVVGAVSLPIIVRQGRLSAEAALSNLRIDGTTLNVQLHRSGARTIRGDLTAYFELPGSKSKVKIGYIKELALYAPNSERQVRMPLSTPAGGPLRRGKVVLNFEEPAATKDRAKASAELTLPD